MAVSGLMTLRAARSVAGPAMVALVERALACGVLDLRVSGTREEVLAEMRGEEVGPSGTSELDERGQAAGV
jgi:hypothetical protein